MKYVCIISFNVYYNTGYVDILKDKVYFLRRQQHNPPINAYINFEWSVSDKNITYEPYIGSNTFFVNTLCVISDEKMGKYFIPLSKYREQQLNEILN